MKKNLIIMMVFLSGCMQNPAPTKPVCNPENIKQAISQLNGIIDGKQSQQNTGSGQLTDEMRLQIVDYSTKTIEKINHIPNIECVKEPASHLVNLYSIFRDVYSLENKATGTENMQKLFLASQEMELYKSSIKVVTQ